MKVPNPLAIISWSGRSPRKTFWLYLGFFFLTTLFSAVMLSARGAHTANGAPMIWVWFSWLAWPPFLGATVRRLHDRDFSAWWLLPFIACPLLFLFAHKALRNLDAPGTAALVNLLGTGLYLWGHVQLCFLRGTTGPNRYGQDPLQPAASVHPTPQFSPIVLPGVEVKKRSNTKWAFVTAGGALVLFVASAAVEVQQQLKGVTPQMREQIVGCSRAQRFARAKAPSAAVFDSCSPTSIAIRVATDEWMARGYFTDERSKARFVYLVKMRHTVGSKEWSLINVAIRARRSTVREAETAKPAKPLAPSRNI